MRNLSLRLGGEFVEIGKMRVALLDPKISTEEFEFCLRELESIRVDLIFSLCSSAQAKYFRDRHFTVIDIGEKLLPIGERDALMQELGSAETSAYYDDKNSVPEFPYNPVIIAGGIHNIVSYSIIQLLTFTKCISAQEVSAVYVFGSKEFERTLKACLRYYRIDAPIRWIKNGVLRKEWHLKVFVRDFLSDIVIFLCCVSNSSICLFYNSKSARRYVSSRSDIKRSYAIRLRSFWPFFPKAKALDDLEFNSNVSYEKIRRCLRSGILLDALDILHLVCIRPLYPRIVATVSVYGFLTRRSKKVVFVSDLNHGESHLFVKLFASSETVFVQHAVIPGSNRAGILNHLDYKKIVLHSKFHQGKLATVCNYCESMSDAPYIHNWSRSDAINRKKFKTILFAPTTLNFIFSDYEHTFFLNTCESLNNYSSINNFKTVIKFHQKTPYLPFLYEQLSCFSFVRIQNNGPLSDLMVESDIIISSENSNTIIEGFFYGLPVIIYNPLRRLNYLTEYEPCLIEVNDSDSLLKCLDLLLTDERERSEAVRIQNEFVRRYITQ